MIDPLPQSAKRAGPPLTRLFLAAAAVRLAGAASGQLFALAQADGALVGLAASLWVGFIGAAYFGVELLGAPFAGLWGDRIGHARVLRIGVVLGAGSAAAASALRLVGGDSVGAIALLFAARALEGASAACIIPSTLTLVASASGDEPRRRARYMGAFEILSLVAMIAGYAVAGVAWEHFGPPTFLGLVAIQGAAWWAARGVEARAPRRASAPGVTGEIMGGILRIPGALGFATSWLAVNAIVGAWLQHGPYLLALPARSRTQALVGGFSGSEVGWIFATWGGCVLLGIALWSVLGARQPPQRVLRIASAGMLGATAVLLAINLGAPHWLLAIGCAFVVVESGYAPAALGRLVLLARDAGHAPGALIGGYSVVLAGGQLLGALLAGPVVGLWQMNGLLGLTAVLAVVALTTLVGPTTARGAAAGSP